jgi:hypothetical protein
MVVWYYDHAACSVGVGYSVFFLSWVTDACIENWVFGGCVAVTYLLILFAEVVDVEFPAPPPPNIRKQLPTIK